MRAFLCFSSFCAALCLYVSPAHTILIILPHFFSYSGGNLKQRAMRLDTGNFSWGSEVATRKARIIDVVYNASNNELVRTKTLVKGCIVQIESTPFRQWYESHYGVKVGMRKSKRVADEAEVKKSYALTKKLAARQVNRVLDPNLDDQFASGRLLACVHSRPGQSGRADGYILEGQELQFYQKMLKRKGK